MPSRDPCHPACVTRSKHILSALASLLALQSASAALSVNLNPFSFVSPEAEISVSTQVITPPGLTVTNYFFGVDPNSSYIGGFGGTYFFRSTDNPAVGTEVDASGFTFYQAQVPGSSSYFAGAQQGDDNWVYITNNEDEVAWAQVDVQEGVITPIKYVFDSADRTADIQLADAVTAVPEPSAFALLAGCVTLLYAGRRRR